MEKRVRDATKYPKIFTCYWGNFKLNGEEKRVAREDIINNRNEFVEFFKIKRSTKHNYMYQKKFFPEFKRNEFLESKDKNYYFLDNVEQYITEHKYSIMVISPYVVPYIVSEKHLEYLEKNDWIKYKKLYSPSSTTFIKIVKL